MTPPHPRVSALILVAFLSAFAVLIWPPGVPDSAAQQDQRYFGETGFRISNDNFWNFFQRRGGVKTFGYPTSREFMFNGMQVQFFQRGVMQLWPDGSVKSLNLLDDGLLPYTRVNGSTFPAAQASVVKAAPAPTDPNYASKIMEFVRSTAPDTWQGLPVNFLKTFNSTVSYEIAFPNGDGPASLVPLINLELWGAPTSEPARDPNNNNFVYQRFQRQIAHYDDACKCTQGVLLGDALKSVITGQNLPADLEEQAKSSPLYRQYEAGAANGLKRPDVKELAGTNMASAFEADSPQSGAATASAPAPANASTSNQPSRTKPEAAAAPPRSQPYRSQSPEYGMNVFLWGNPSTTDRDLNQIKQANFGWQKTLFQWRLIEGAGKGLFDWSESDRVVAASKKAGVKIIARLDFQPVWSRADNAHNGPPDNYQDFADFVGAFVERYKTGSSRGEVHAIEIWNEPNIDREWGMGTINKAQAADYVGLLKGAYLAAKQVDPSVTVISAGLSPTCTDNNNARPDDTYLQWMYEAGAAPYFDVLGAHGAGFDKPPSASTQESAAKHSGCPVFTFRRVEDLRAVMERNGDGAKQVWLLEFGWTTDRVHPDYSWFAVSPETHALYLVDAYTWAKQNWGPWIGVMTLWNMPDPGWGPDREEYWWGVTNPDGTPRPAFEQLSRARREGALR